MRDTHRMKEKYELSLDNRQIVSLTVVGLVVVSAVFALGIVVGKKLATEDQATTSAPDLLSALDQKAAKIETMKKDASLTFQEELTKKQAPIVEANEPIIPPKPELPVVVAKAEPPKPPEPKPEPVVKAEAVPTRINEDAGALREAIAKTATKAPPPETSPDGAFTLQLSAFQDKAEADRFAANLRDKGYAPFIVEADLKAKGIWYRVRMGRFPSKDAAGRYLADFKRETSIDAIVTGAN